MKKIIKGGNTNLYRTPVKPRIVKKKKRSKPTRGGGIFSYLAKGLSRVKNKIPSSIASVAKRAVRKGTLIAKKQLRDPQVQRAIQSAVTHGTKLATTHILQKAGVSTNNERVGKVPKERKRRVRGRRKVLFD